MSDNYWADTARHYRIPLSVSANGYERNNRPVEFEIDFTAMLNSLGANAEFAVDSLRVVEVDASGMLVNDTVPFQFDPAEGFNSVTNARGEIITLLEGQTLATDERHFQLYFDTSDNGPFLPVAVAPRVVTTDNVLDAGQLSYRLETANATYYYHKEGGGFSSLDDSEGNDWISHSTATGSAGDFRGIPNMVHPLDGGFFHPGRNTASSSIANQGPLKTTIISTTDDGLWQVQWEIYPEFAQMTVLKADGAYWFLYEGTPGGSLDLTTDLVTRSDGTQTTAATQWSGDLLDQEWLYFSDSAIGRSLYFVHHEDDVLVDSYYQMEQAMTVFGFGRSGNARFLGGINNHFTLGLSNGTTFADISRDINSAYRPLAITIGHASANSLLHGGTDIVALNFGPAADQVWFSNGTDVSPFFRKDWGFNESGTYEQMISGDYNADGLTDFLAFNPGSGGDALWYATGYVTSPYFAKNYGFREDGTYDQMITGDYNNDGRTDILALNYGSGSDALWYATGTASAPYFIKNWGFTEAGTYDEMIPGDFNNDGRTDILALNYGSGSDAVWYATGTASPPFFTKNWGFTEDGTYDEMIAGDYNGDGRTDILALNYGTGSDAVWYATGTANPPYFIKNYGFREDGTYDEMITGDYNGDGRTDILALNYGSGSDALWYATGAVNPPYFTKHYSFSEEGTYDEMITGDYNNDGLTDILAVKYGVGTDALWYATGTDSPPFFTKHLGFSEDGAYDLLIPGDFNYDLPANPAALEGSLTIERNN